MRDQRENCKPKNYIQCNQNCFVFHSVTFCFQFAGVLLAAPVFQSMYAPTRATASRFVRYAWLNSGPAPYTRLIDQAPPIQLISYCTRLPAMLPVRMYCPAVSLHFFMLSLSVTALHHCLAWYQLYREIRCFSATRKLFYRDKP